jgi:hypothetical protein
MPPQLRTRTPKTNPNPNQNPIIKPAPRGRRGRPARNRNPIVDFARDNQIHNNHHQVQQNEQPHAPLVRVSRDIVIKQDIMDDDCDSGGRTADNKAPVAEDEGTTPPIPEKVFFIFFAWCF